MAHLTSCSTPCSVLQLFIDLRLIEYLLLFLLIYYEGEGSGELLPAAL